MTSVTPLVGRILLAVVFLMAGFSKVTNPGGTAQMIGSAGLPLPDLLTWAAIAIELGAGVLVLAGYQTRIAAAVLGGFTILATAFFHANLADQVQMLMFLKNVAIVGGLLMLATYGPGSISADERARRQAPVAQVA